jgi:hypothetical protein
VRSEVSPLLAAIFNMERSLMHILLSTSAAETGHDNEDFVIATPGAAVLLDGSQTAVERDPGCFHGVVWYVQTLGTILLAEILGGSSLLPKALWTSIRRVGSLHEATCQLDYAGSPASTVVAMRVNATDLEYLVLGDSTLMLDRSDNNPQVISDDRETRVGCQYRATMDKLRTASLDHAIAHRGYVKALHAHRNRPGGYWIASGDPNAATEAVTGIIPIRGLRAVALLSDGASRLVDRFHLVSWADVAKLLEESGPSELIRRVRGVEDGDPTGQRWPRTKARDDITVAYLRLQ